MWMGGGGLERTIEDPVENPVNDTKYGDKNPPKIQDSGPPPPPYKFYQFNPPPPTF